VFFYRSSPKSSFLPGGGVSTLVLVTSAIRFVAFLDEPDAVFCEFPDGSNNSINSLHFVLSLTSANSLHSLLFVSSSSLYSRVKLLDGASKFAFSKNLRTSPLARGIEEERGAKKQESTRTRRFIMGSQMRLSG
jgi:hypothetical protein